MNTSVNVNIDVEELKKIKIFVATPMYGGQCSGIFTKSCLELQKLFSKYEMDCEFNFILGESLITRARNNLVDKFLKSHYTHLLFIDSDIGFNHDDVFSMLFFDKDVIAAPYSKKYIRWDKVITAVKNNPQITPNEVERISGSFVMNLPPNVSSFRSDEPLEVLDAGTGFMMIKKEVFNKMSLEYPDLKYKLDDRNFDESKGYIKSFFDTFIDDENSLVGENTGRYLSEDYAFCKLWRNIGGQIFICPWMITRHNGSFEFVSDLGYTSKLTGNI